jgi:TonB family protein
MPDCGGPRTTSEGILLPKVLHHVEPDLSACAGQRGTGNAVVEVTIDRTGNVESFKMVRTASRCVNEAVASAVRQWKFCPAEKDGKALEMTMHLTVHINYR